MSSIDNQEAKPASTRNNRNRLSSSTMRRNQPRPTSTDSNPARATSADSLTKKVFNCIVDDSALLAGAKTSTRDGIRKWIANGQIRLFVPLYTLGQTSRLKDGSGRISADAEDALLWLDEATTESPHLVTLQGGYEKFDTWAEVEKFALPRTLFSEGDEDTDDDSVDQHLRPLFNYILWRIHQEIDPEAALESFIFLSDDPSKNRLAQRFGIRVKSLADIRFVVAREERESRNRQVVQQKEIALRPLSHNFDLEKEAKVNNAEVADRSDDDDEILLKRPPTAPAAMLALDPDQFSRGPSPASARGDTRGNTFRGGGSMRGGSRGAAARGGSVRGVFRGTNQPPRGPAAAGTGRGTMREVKSEAPIDPESFARPSARGRGAGRRLYIPT